MMMTETGYGVNFLRVIYGIYILGNICPFGQREVYLHTSFEAGSFNVYR